MKRSRSLSFPPAHGAVSVIVDARTLLMDDDHLGGVDLTALDPDVSFIRVRGHPDASRMLIASAVKVESTPEGYAIEGPLDTDGLVPDVSVSVLGVTVMLDAETWLEGGTPAAGTIDPASRRVRLERRRPEPGDRRRLRSRSGRGVVRRQVRKKA
jgi:hypothetical protein